MFSALISRWRNWRSQRTIEDAEQALNVLRKMQRDDDELVRLMAALTILKLDPTKSDELTPLIQAAQGSENLAVSNLAEEFIEANWRQNAA
jgi:hypothetical protein